MRKSVEFGPLHVSWGDDIMQDDQGFYGVAVSRTPFQWVFFGLAVDRTEQRHRDERQRLWEIFYKLESLIWTRDRLEDPMERGRVSTSDVRKLLNYPSPIGVLDRGKPTGLG